VQTLQRSVYSLRAKSMAARSVEFWLAWTVVRLKDVKFSQMIG
jgi:hypothetical protein